MARSSPRHVSFCIPVWRLLGGRGIGGDDTSIIGNCARLHVLLQDVCMCIYAFMQIYMCLHCYGSQDSHPFCRSRHIVRPRIQNETEVV